TCASLSKQPRQTHGFASAVDGAKLLRELLHRLSRLQHAVDVRRLHAAAARDPPLSRAVDQLWVRPFFGRHRKDDGLHPADLGFAVNWRSALRAPGLTRSRDLFLQGSARRDADAPPLPRAHAAPRAG